MFLAQTSSVTDFGSRLVDAVSTAITTLFNAVPTIIGALIILVIGWIIAGIVARIVLRILQTIKFNSIVERTGAPQYLTSTGAVSSFDSSAVAAGLVRWFIRLITLVAVANALGLTAVSTILNEVILFIPNLIVALVILIIGSFVAKFVGKIVYGSLTAARYPNPSLIARLANYGVLAFFVVMALTQIGVGTFVVSTLFGAISGGAALAFGLAFGLGGRDAAAGAIRSLTQPTPTLPPTQPTPRG